MVELSILGEWFLESEVSYKNKEFVHLTHC